jgi:hypothetical protein
MENVVARYRRVILGKFTADALCRRVWRPPCSPIGSPHGSGLGVFRWVVERTLAWLHRFRRLALRCELRADGIGLLMEGPRDGMSPST